MLMLVATEHVPRWSLLTPHLGWPSPREAHLFPTPPLKRGGGCCPHPPPPPPSVGEAAALTPCPLPQAWGRLLPSPPAPSPKRGGGETRSRPGAGDRCRRSVEWRAPAVIEGRPGGAAWRSWSPAGLDSSAHTSSTNWRKAAATRSRS